MLLTVDFFVVEEDTFGQPGTLKVVVSGAGACAAANSGSNFLTAVTTLREEGEGERVRWRWGER